MKLGGKTTIKSGKSTLFARSYAHSRIRQNQSLSAATPGTSKTHGACLPKSSISIFQKNSCCLVSEVPRTPKQLEIMPKKLLHSFAGASHLKRRCSNLVQHP